MSFGALYAIALDHSRQAMEICTADSKFKFFTIVNKREI